MSRYAILVKIWKWLKLLNSVPLIKKTLVNQTYVRIWSSWLTFTVLQLMKTTYKISQFSRFLLMSGYAILVKIWKWLKLLNSFPSIKKPLVNQVSFEFDNFDWLSKLYRELRQTSKLVNLKISDKVRVCDFSQNLKMTNTSQFCCIRQESTCKSSLHLNLIIFAYFHHFTVNEENLRN